ncbi:hypothetical protein M409DRAFT_30225 [Zasmidium cellare ATCC 36951]|uniref:Uncharacterized protein n=1 Tax=Zasmidium cellare ATCC 36951 TaxID=1080233 RepID=A0A6A6BX36_ZASCE|nr:uncharacterized protein M409DRAFT_30225 [Zasmidium cellare ATCC 36951]KAF2159347.1 hypothetical protein M409DRAFT_30225 [Zasmidium cellare ATCC 36951]
MGRSSQSLDRKRTKLLNWERRQRSLDNQNTPLLILAPELRNKIFALALPSGQFFNTTFKHDFKSCDGQERSVKLLRTAVQYKREFGLTQVCRQIRGETIRVVYSVNTFALGVQPRDVRVRAERWIESRPEEVLSVIQRVVLQRKEPYKWDGDGDGDTSMHCMLFDFVEKKAWTISDDRAYTLHLAAGFERNTFSHFVDPKSWSAGSPRLRLLQLCHDFRRGWRFP